MCVHELKQGHLVVDSAAKLFAQNAKLFNNVEDVSMAQQ
jgi:hypothetical protein